MAHFLKPGVSTQSCPVSSPYIAIPSLPLASTTAPDLHPPLDDVPVDRQLGDKGGALDNNPVSSTPVSQQPRISTLEGGALEYQVCEDFAEVQLSEAYRWVDDKDVSEAEEAAATVA